MYFKYRWIKRTILKFRRVEKRLEGGLKLPKGNKTDLKKYKTEAKKLVEEKILEFNKFYGFKYNRITIRNTKSRWGSCSTKGNLSFNYRIVMLPPVVADYLVVHELCHLGEMNHSAAFWALVARTVPDYKQRRKELRLARSV